MTAGIEVLSSGGCLMTLFSRLPRLGGDTAFTKRTLVHV
jgi:hypothetical protein